jgi:Ca-activated chloride channel homolog
MIRANESLSPWLVAQLPTTWPEFEQPLWLLLLPGVAVLAIWWLRRKPVALRFPDTSMSTAINTPRGTFSRRCGALGRGLGLAAGVIALAGPRWPDPGSRVPTEGIAILLVVDVSNSMNEEDFVWQDKPMKRIQAMKQALRLFVAGGAGPHNQELPGRPQDLIGLVTFTRLPKSSCPLTLSHDALLQMLDREETNKGGHDFDTNIGDAIIWAIDRLNTSPVKQKVMVLVTDGEQGEIPGAPRPRQAAQLAAHFGIPIFTIDAGNEAATTGKTPADQIAAENRNNAKKTLQDIAKLTSGQYYGAADGKTLMEACGNLASQLDSLESEQIETWRRLQYFQGFAWLGGTSFVLWFVVLGLDLTLWRRLP